MLFASLATWFFPGRIQIAKHYSAKHYSAEQWAAWVGEQRESDLNVAKFCDWIVMSRNSFYGWRRKLAVKGKPLAKQQHEAKRLSAMKRSISSGPELVPLSVALFLFQNRTRDRLKILYWDRDGLANAEGWSERRGFRRQVSPPGSFSSTFGISPSKRIGLIMYLRDGIRSNRICSLELLEEDDFGRMLMETKNLIGLFARDYLSRFDEIAHRRFSCNTQADVHKYLADRIRGPASAVKLWRDEFDSIHPNSRKDWHNRKMVPSRVPMAEMLEGVSKSGIYRLLDDSMQNPDADVIEMLQQAQSVQDETVRAPSTIR